MEVNSSGVVNKVKLSKDGTEWDIEDKILKEILSKNYYNKNVIDNLVKDLSGISVVIVDVLPETDIRTNVIYFVKKLTKADGYDEYMYINDAWELIGATNVDLSQYYTKNEIDDFLEAKQDKLIIDDNLSNTSINPVQNKAIKNELDRKVNNDKYTNDLKSKVDKIDGKGLTTNDYTDADKQKVDNIPDNFISAIKRNGETLGLETDNSVNIEVPEKVEDLSDAADYAKNSSLHKVATSGKYSDLDGKPIYLSEFENDINFILNTVDNLTNYYLKSETYTKTEIQNEIAKIKTISIKKVEILPTTDISTNVIYLIPKSDAISENIYNEYIYIDNKWELIGSTQIDLSNYVTKAELDTELSGKKDNFTTLPINQGGTGKTTAKAASNSLFGGINEVTTEIDEDTLFAGVYKTPSDSNGAIYKRKASSVWDYLQKKSDIRYAALSHTHNKADVGLDKVENLKAVSTESNQGLSDDEKLNARDNIGAGTSNLVLGTTENTAAAGNHKHVISDIYDGEIAFQKISKEWINETWNLVEVQ